LVRLSRAKTEDKKKKTVLGGGNWNGTNLVVEEQRRDDLLDLEQRDEFSQADAPAGAEL
jgi:hypothetical protein